MSRPKWGVEEIKWLVKGGAMQVTPRTSSITAEEKFGNCRLHLEFRTPFMPDARGQGRGNSGVYLQGRYEVQILDSYGLEGMGNECGGIYRVGRPLVNLRLLRRCTPGNDKRGYFCVIAGLAPRSRFAVLGTPFGESRGNLKRYNRTLATSPFTGMTTNNESNLISIVATDSRDFSSVA
jgi:hypothetical protein